MCAALDKGIQGMPKRFGALEARILIALSIVLIGAMMSTPALAQDSDGGDSLLEIEATFDTADAPDGPYHAHQSMLRFPPGAEAPLHHHGGPGYITILQGELTLFEDGQERIYSAGDSLIETTDRHYKGGNDTESDTVLMVTYLVPEGEDVTTVIDDPDAPEPPEIVAEPLAEVVHEFADPPASYDLIHRTSIYEADQGELTFTPSGNILMTVVDGALEIAGDTGSKRVGSGEYVLLDGGDEQTLTNPGDEPAVTMSTELDTSIYGVVPETGSAVDRTFAMWLIFMTASALLVVGAVLRLTATTYRHESS